MTKDPVCEMPIQSDESDIFADYNGRTYYFCSTNCREEFLSDPEKYLAGLVMDDEADYQDEETQGL